MSNDIDNLRRVIRLVEEMEAYFAKPESPPSESTQPVDVAFPQRRRGRLGRGAGNTLHVSHAWQLMAEIAVKSDGLESGHTVKFNF